MRNRAPSHLLTLLSVLLMNLVILARSSGASPPLSVQANCVAEITLSAGKSYPDPFTSVTLDVMVTDPNGKTYKVPAFWAGGTQWCFRYASNRIGTHRYRTECSDTTNLRLHGVTGKIEVVPYRGKNPLSQHGQLRVSKDQRHFEHADGTPFFWLGDTWWKGLCKRLTLDGFQQLTADRKAKGFSVVQIVCGPYPDEGLFEPRWENEGGKPYETKDFRRVNPAYFAYADRRIRHLVEAGIVPAIVGGWGRGGSLEVIGSAGYKRHWRNLIARYGAYPTVWIVGGEAEGPQWTEVAKYVQQTDPFHHLTTMHPFQSARSAVTDETVLTFDMLQTGHGDWEAAHQAAYSRSPIMPAMVGECCYEGHMQTAFQDVQRYLFWGCLLNGAAGHTYGAAGIWHASVDGNPGITPVYDLTTWKEGMNAPGAIQLGLGKKLLERYPWARFEPHPEWAEPGSFAAGIPGEVRFVYQPRRGVYNWQGTVVKQIESNVPYHAFYFNPTNAKQHDLGTFIGGGTFPQPFQGHTQPLLFADRFRENADMAWKDYGTPSRREGGRLIGRKGMVTVMEKVNQTNLMASVDAKSNAEAGIILRFQDPTHYLVALYSPLLKTIYIHDRKNGEWGDFLGRVEVPEIGPNIHLTAAVYGEDAALVLTDGKKTYSTLIVKVTNLASGKAGLWLYQIGNRQEYSNFELSTAQFEKKPLEKTRQGHRVLWSEEYSAPPLPSPQDWVLVLERVKGQGAF